MSQVFRTFVVPAATVNDSRAAAGYAFPGNTGMYLTPCSPTGIAPATFYISSGQVDSAFAALFPYTRAILQPNGTYQMIFSSAGNATTVYNQCVANGYAITQAAVTALLTASDISDQPPFAALARMGLQLMQTP